MKRAWNVNSRSSWVVWMSLPHGSRQGCMKPTGLRVGRSFGHSSSGSKLTRIRSVWCSGLTLLLKHHSFPQKKIPKVCNIVGGMVSPLLANIALYGMEEALLNAYIGESKAPSAQREPPHLHRYDDHFVLLNEKQDAVSTA